MSVFEVHGGGDRRSLIKRFMSKSKQDAVSELVEIHLTHCTRAERLEAENEALRKDAERYRFLMKSEDPGDADSMPAGFYVSYADGRGFGEYLIGDEASREIDEAMSKAVKP